MTATRVLLAAATRIEEVGLWQSGVPGTTSGTCPLIALGDEAGADKAAYGESLDRLRVHLGVAENMDIARWSDTPGRSAKEVASAMRAAAGVA